MTARDYTMLLLAAALLASCGKSEDQIRTEERVKMLEERLAENKRNEADQSRGEKRPTAAATSAAPRSVQARANSDTSSSLIGSYEAYIGQDDLFNSSGARLTTPAAILRQDRANFHRFGVRQNGDTEDSFFASAANRSAMERMVAGGAVMAEAQRLILAGGATIHVDIYGSGNTGNYLDITVS